MKQWSAVHYNLEYYPYKGLWDTELHSVPGKAWYTCSLWMKNSLINISKWINLSQLKHNDYNAIYIKKSIYFIQLLCISDTQNKIFDPCRGRSSMNGNYNQKNITWWLQRYCADLIQRRIWKWFPTLVTVFLQICTDIYIYTIYVHDTTET